MDILSEAIIFAVKAHDGMTRKSSTLPYIVHPMEVAVIASTMTQDKTVLSAAVLHDVVEDTPVTIDEIKEVFSEEIASLVAYETENKRVHMSSAESWQTRKEEAINLLKKTQDIRVKIIFLSDKLANMRSFYEQYLVHGEKLWSFFNQKDPSKQYWYYKSICDATEELSDFKAWKEYKSLLNIVFEKELQNEH